jgi:hypothetical protein
MFWGRYGSVVAWLFAVGVAVGAVFLLLFAWVVPPDRGEEGVIVLLPFVGAFFGAVTAGVAALGYWFALALWTRPARRSVPSRALMGAIGAGAGAMVFWIGFGFALSGAYGLPVWGVLGLICALIAALVAGPLTARAARRADRAGSAGDAPNSPAAGSAPAG